MSNQLKKTTMLSEIFKGINLHSILDKDIKIDFISDSSNGVPNSICDYIKGELPKNHEDLILLVREAISGYNCVVVENPQIIIVDIIKYIKANIGFEAKYQYSKIPSSVKIGENVVIEENVEIGEHTVIEHNAVIHSGTKIGKNCLIRTHASIGGDGYGYIDTGKGLVKQPHLGGVTLSDNVEIGSNTCVVRGMINDTYLGESVKVDNLVHIAHDCFIDDYSFIIAGAELSGYVSVGKRSRVAPNACVKQRLSIGNDAIVGLGAVVTKNVPDGKVVAGNPAKILNRT
ncbi:UDP-3-O-(3-hydroxymyristoyl)glucosamine N-acyltransferase [Colwellia psychrerythraea]|uniref:Transferase hexapeptide repeat containing protein n=1 Tax=Colwellia psychrerythraea TaxID=28229 RepID=A0A099KUQ7_COLPS|nr:UDP-3-O-(3-hydroxymyristoyl)glucosamine N-acyltransferase [Colwellia psychrerythraea]KGJ93582.1 transferase hexapeptide repeat containing protein [Colwellia psychrerythraea]